MKRTLLIAPLFLVGHALLAQTDSTQTGESMTPDANANVFNLSLEDLMDVKVVSASKKAESAFDAPLSIGSVSREEIKKAGSTSIMDALRLIPGLIVRETTNGNYDVHIRGFADLPPGGPISQSTNTTILVMIDNRPVYNYFTGGTFWETLPVDLNDVERIEVVRGPASSLYGPNAANGMINIITRRAQKEGIYAVGNAQGGSASTYIGNASVGYKTGKFDFIVSGNYQTRNRFEDGYYSWVRGEKVEADSVKVAFPSGSFKDINGQPNSSERYPNQSLAQSKGGYNGFFNYALNEKTIIGLNIGGQQSKAQTVGVENLGTPLSYRLSSSNYADLRARVYGLNTQVSYQLGTQDVCKGYNGYKYNFNTLDALAEYDINFLEYFSVKPGVNYRSATYDDSKYSDIANERGFINGSRTLDNIAGSIRAEYDSKKAVKLTAGIRYDKYNYPSAGYLSYQFAANVKINERNLLRAVYSRSFRGPTMYDTYNSQSLFLGYSSGIPFYADITGNNNLSLQKMDMFELGYRLKATDFLHFDLEVFYQTADNYNTLVSQPNVIQGSPIPTKISTAQTVQNINLRAEQRGGTLSLNFAYSKFQFKPFVTLQQTLLYNVPSGRDAAGSLVNTTFDGSNSSSPSYFGGAYLNYQATSKLNLNLNGYYYNKYTFVGIYYYFDADKSKGVVNISDKVILNARASYKLFNRLDVFVNVRNGLNTQAQEFSNTDITKALYLVGGNFEF